MDFYQIPRIADKVTEEDLDRARANILAAYLREDDTLPYEEAYWHLLEVIEEQRREDESTG